MGSGSNGGKGRKKATKSHGKEEAKKMVTDEQPIRCTNCGKKVVGPRIVGASPGRRRRPTWPRLKKRSSLCFW
jgi:hypothetical protein